MNTAIREFTRGLFLQLHVINAIILRETRTRFGRHSLGFVWAFLEPLSSVGFFWLMFYFTGRSAPSGMDPTGFLCTGFLPFGLFSGTMNRAQSAVQSNLALLYFPQVHTLDLVAARSILEVVTVTITFFFFMLLYTMFTQHFPLESALKTIAGLSFAALLGTGLGLCFNSITCILPSFQHFVGLLVRPLFWISALFFSITEVPVAYREYLWWNPVIHFVELTRDGWFKSYDYQFYSYSYLMYWILGVSFVGLLSEKLTRKYVLAG